MTAPTTDHGLARRSTEKKPLGGRAVHRLPDEIIQQILEIADPNSFASLILLNRDWRRVSQQAHLYVLHLSQCPSYAASHSTPPPTASEENLPRLRRLFAREVKRNLFEAYLRPTETVIKLISNSISAASCPGGEGMQFSPSPRGHHLLAYNSSRIYVIDVRGPSIEVKRELGILRRPVSTCIRDDGLVLAVLSTEMQVDIYSLREAPPKRTQSIILDHSPRTIAMSPCGSVLAAAYEGGIEVSSIYPGALATDRRAVKCDGVDSLAFSFDGTQLLGTTIHSSPPNTVILTAPYYDPGNQLADDNISALWTTSILFPNTSRDCSHAVLLQDSSQEEACWTFTYDRSFETFRAVRIDDLRNGTTYFTGPIPSRDSQAKLIPCTLPSATYHGELVSAGFQGKDIWLYGVPEDLVAIADSVSSGGESGSSAGALGRRNSGPSSRNSARLQESNPGRVPQWQLLVDKLRNTFVGGSKVAELPGVSNVKWVSGFGDSSSKERLVIAARGVLPPKPITEEDDLDFVDGGRITLLDFDYGTGDGLRTEITIEVGTKEAEVLEEEQRDMETEVAIVRRRTVAQRGGHRNALLRAATSAARNNPLPPLPPPPRAAAAADDDPLLPRRVGPRPPTVTPASPVSDDADTASMIEEQEALDAPYSQGSPRSGTTLRRAATAAAANRRLQPQQAAAGPVVYRRADGRTEHPHESDADNWVPPPPPYQKEDPGDIPVFLRHAPVAPPVGGLGTTGPVAPAQQSEPVAEPAAKPAATPAPKPQRAAPSSSTWLSPQSQPQSQQQSQQRDRQPSAPSTTSQQPHHRTVSASTTASRPLAESSSRPMSGPAGSQFDMDELYDVSPPDSPRLTAARAAVTGQSTDLPGEVAHPPNSGVVTVQNTPWGSSTASASDSSRTPAVAIPSVAWAPSAASASASSRTPAAGPALQPLETSPRSPQRVDRGPALDLQIPSPTFSSSGWFSGGDSNGTAAGRRLSNSQTWPTQPKGPLQPQTGLETGYPHTAPPTGASANDMIAAGLPPAPRPDQLASLNNRTDQSPRRFSGGFHVPRVPVGTRNAADSPRQPYQPVAQPAPRLNIPAAPFPVEDQPLIISTPTGVSGAFDPPGRQTSGRRTQTPLLAPIPRHPRTASGSGPLRPTVERLETIYSIASQGSAAEPPQSRSGGSILPSWLTAPSSSNGRTSNLNRKQSRAERSAARNMADAKKKGWNGGKTKKKKTTKKRVDHEVASSAAWTDVSTRSAGGDQAAKDKKCVVM